jgi:hypothetical protein
MGGKWAIQNARKHARILSDVREKRKNENSCEKEERVLCALFVKEKVSWG